MNRFAGLVFGVGLAVVVPHAGCSRLCSTSSTLRGGTFVPSGAAAFVAPNGVDSDESVAVANYRIVLDAELAQLTEDFDRDGKHWTRTYAANVGVHHE